MEAIRVTSEKKKQCNSKALEIVTTFCEGTVSETCLIKNLQFINQEHYQDIIEERAINKFCGYPLCGVTLKRIPAKQYHISTTHNKVFDITDRKNFCSNLCYKASKYLKDQILTSPLWLREENNSPAYTFISLQSEGGIAGDEVNLGIVSLKTDLDDISTMENITSSSQSEKNYDSNLPEVEVSNTQTLREECKFETNGHQSSRYGATPFGLRNVNVNNIVTVHSDQDNRTEHIIDSIDPNDEQKLVGISENKTIMAEKSENFISGEVNKLILYPLETNTKALNQCSDNEKSKKSTHNEIKSENTIKATDTITQKLISQSCKNSPNLKSSRKHVSTNISPMQNIVMKIEKVLKEWFSLDSVCYIFGEEKVKEILIENRSYITEYHNTTAAVDTQFYDRYLSICRKLNILEMEDTKEDAVFREETKKPLPDYEALKVEAKNLDLKVKMFYKGDKVVHFKEQIEEVSDNTNITQEPILPLVDLHAQKALRRRIVIDKFRRVFHDLQKSLGLKDFNLNEDMRNLIGTFTLSAHNITMKPAEWTLMAIVMIKLLSLKDKALEQGLHTSSSSKHLILLLMSYSLDLGYLDCLVAWLTNVKSLIKKTED